MSATLRSMGSLVRVFEEFCDVLDRARVLDYENAADLLSEATNSLEQIRMTPASRAFKLWWLDEAVRVLEAKDKTGEQRRRRRGAVA